MSNICFMTEMDASIISVRAKVKTDNFVDDFQSLHERKFYLHRKYSFYVIIPTSTPPGRVVPVRVLSMGEINMFANYAYYIVDVI